MRDGGDRKRYTGNLKAVAGIHQALEAISWAAKCVASSSDVEKLRLTLEITDLHDSFTPHDFSASQVARGKPAPDLFLFAAEEMNTPAGSSVVIEDSVAGIQAAVAAGMKVIGFVGGLSLPSRPCGEIDGNRCYEDIQPYDSVARDLSRFVVEQVTRCRKSFRKPIP